MTIELETISHNRIISNYSKDVCLLASLRVHIAINLTNLFELDAKSRDTVISVAYIIDSPEMFSAFNELVQDTIKLIQTGDLSLLNKYSKEDLLVMKLSTVVYLKASSEFDIVKVSDSEEDISDELKSLAEDWARELL